MTDLQRDGARRRFPHLFAPLDLRGHRLPNRIVLTAHTTSYGQDGVPGRRAAAYYGARAAGGAGLIVMEPLPVHPTGGVTPQNYRFADERFVDGLRGVVAAVHEHGATLVSQLYHLGPNADAHATLRERWGPSASAVPHAPGRVHAMDERDIQALVDGHERAACAALEAGVDGVECMFAYDTVVDGFMSEDRNCRDDGYGGSFEGRMRLAREILVRLRAVVGEERLLGVTLTASMPGFAAAGAYVEERCAIDYIGVGHGDYDQPHLIIAPMEVEPGFGVAGAAALKQASPASTVIAEGRINRAEIAERALAQGACDLVGMTRALIADPELPRKVARGADERVRACVAYNLCIQRRYRKFPIACVQNPAAGLEETHRDPPRRAAAALPVVIVGGGLAGLEAARMAALRGHDVTLLEREDALGGQVRLLARLPLQGTFAELIDWRAAELAALGVRIEHGVATVDGIAVLAPARVLVAAGSAPDRRYPHAVSAVAVLGGSPLRAGGVVVIDEEGHRKGLGLAEQLAASGRQVTLVTDGVRPGQVLEDTFVAGLALERLHGHGVALVEGHRVVAVEPGGVRLRRTYDGSPLELEAAAVVHAGRHVACDDLVSALRSRSIDAVAIGDARAPRQVEDAIRDGFDEGGRI